MASTQTSGLGTWSCLPKQEPSRRLLFIHHACREVLANITWANSSLRKVAESVLARAGRRQYFSHLSGTDRPAGLVSLVAHTHPSHSASHDIRRVL